MRGAQSSLFYFLYAGGRQMTYREEDYDKTFEEYNVEPEIISDGDEFDSNYGTDYALLTDEHIKALQEGKVLYVDINCGEYCCLIKKAEKTKND